MLGGNVSLSQSSLLDMALSVSRNLAVITKGKP